MANNFGRVNVSVTASTGGLTAGLARASKQVKSFASTVGSAVRGLAAPLLVLTSVGTAMAAFGKTASEIDTASKAARRLGMETATFQTLGQVADEAGISVQQMSVMFTFMSRNLANLQNGSKAAETAFGRIGLTFSMLRGLAPEQQFALIAKSIMALPTAAERTGAAMAIFGRSGAMALGMIEDAANGAYAEILQLREAAGVNVTDEQAKGVEMMNDAWGRTKIVVQGFITQLVSGVAPAITTMSNLWTTFSTKTASGWSLANMAAATFSGTIRGIVALATILYGTFQVATSAILKLGQWGISVFAQMNGAIADTIDALAALVESTPGADFGVASSIRAAAEAVRGSGDAAAMEAEAWGLAAADTFASGIENITNPLAAFDTEMASVQEQMAKAGEAAGNKFGQTASQGITASVKASSQSLKALVVGSADAESYANRLSMGFDPRDAGEAEERTAENTERTADGVEDMAEQFAELNLGMASIAV